MDITDIPEITVVLINTAPPSSCLRTCTICHEDLVDDLFGLAGWRLVRWPQPGAMPVATVLVCPSCWALTVSLSTGTGETRRAALAAQEQPLSLWNRGTLLLLLAELLVGPHASPELAPIPLVAA